VGRRLLKTVPVLTIDNVGDAKGIGRYGLSVRNGRAQAKQARKETPNKTGDYEDKNESMIKKKKAFNQIEPSLT
jgi:hypothetical protein